MSHLTAHGRPSGQRSPAPLAWSLGGRLRLRADEAPPTVAPAAHRPAQAERPFPPACAPGATQSWQSKQPCSRRRRLMAEAAATDGRPSRVGRGPARLRTQTHPCKLGLASLPTLRFLRGRETRDDEPQAGQCPAVVPQRPAQGKVPKGRVPVLSGAPGPSQRSALRSLAGPAPQGHGQPLRLGLPQGPAPTLEPAPGQVRRAQRRGWQGPGVWVRRPGPGAARSALGRLPYTYPAPASLAAPVSVPGQGVVTSCLTDREPGLGIPTGEGPQARPGWGLPGTADAGHSPLMVTRGQGLAETVAGTSSLGRPPGTFRR